MAKIGRKCFSKKPFFERRKVRVSLRIQTPARRVPQTHGLAVISLRRMCAEGCQEAAGIGLMADPGQFNTLTPLMAAPPPSLAPQPGSQPKPSSHARIRGWGPGRGIDLSFPGARLPPVSLRAPLIFILHPQNPACLPWLQLRVICSPARLRPPNPVT